MAAAGTNAPGAHALERTLSPPGAPSLERTLSGSTGASAETEARLQSLVKDLFDLADVDCSGTIQFKEFMDHHNRVLEMSSGALGRVEVVTGEEAQKIFRHADKDHNHRLDHDEFFDYMKGFLSVVGVKQFESVCGTLVQGEKMRRAVMAEGFDRKSSERLLEQANVSYFYKQPMKDQALAFLKARADPNMADKECHECRLQGPSYLGLSAHVKDGTTILLHVTGKTDASFVQQLLAARCDPKRHNKELDCPLFRAAAVRHMDVMKVLLGWAAWNDAPTAERAASGGTAVSDASPTSPRKRHALSEELVKQMHELTGIQVRQLVRDKADMNYKAQNGWTPLTLAVFHGKVDCVEGLIKVQDAMTGNKLQLQGKNARGRAPLHLTARKDLAQIARLLITSNADPDVKDADGWTPLHHACFNGNSSVVRELLQGGANLYIQGVGGFTAFLVTKLPQRACDLSDSVVDLIKPGEGVDFQKRLVPIFKAEDMTVLQKIEALMDLPGVGQTPERLRLHEQFFHPLQGPNKVKLKLVWSQLIVPLIPRLRTGEVDIEQTPSPHLSDEAKEAHKFEVKRRQRLQDDFFKQWLLDTRGPRPNYYWKHDNREAYRSELEQMVQFELDQFREEFNQLYEKMVDEEELGLDLSSVPTDEVIHKALLSQLHAHHFPLWLEQLDVQQTFEELRLAGVTGFAGIKDDNVALLNFVEQLTISHNLRAGKMFWRNVYRLWLLRCAQMADHDIARRMRTFVEKFNKENPELAASYQHGPVKTEERTRHKEKTLGFVPSAESFDGRSSASRILVVVRGSITVKSPKAVLKLMESFKKLDRSMDRMILVRQINRFNREAETLEGYRFMEMHVLFRNGVRAASCGREGKTIEVDLLGEVCIVLEDFLQIHKRRHLLFKIKQGIFDWTAEDEEPDADVDLDSSLRGDDLPQ